ncbi:MAG TPA: amidase [Acidimicrobiales bacterium]|jgi:aspartyl-tRNA(Asn)/glutamyl-tRNA(Gln) amidotransferase subunit A
MPELPLSITEAAAALRDGSLTSVELTSAVLAQADAHDAELGSYLARFDEQALTTAAKADSELAQGVDRGPLQGIPLGVKDIIASAEGPTTANSLVLDPAWGAGRDAPVVARLKAAGAVITGKMSTMEFAIGAPDPAKPFALPRNPWDTRTWPGGSSSGTGSGVAAGFILGGLGTDTGGSIRIPAAFCGVSGLMPTFGRVPKSGCAPLGYSLDHIGPLARTAADCAAMLQVLAGYHASDPDCASLPVPDFSAGLGRGSLEGVRVGVERAHHSPDGADPAAGPCFEAAVAALEALGATVVEVVLPYYEEMQAATMVTMAGEALAYHLPDMRTRWSDYFVGTRLIVAQGAMASSADFVQAQRVRRVAVQALGELFEAVDVVATPTASRGATPYDDMSGGVLQVGEIFQYVHTPYWDAVGNPVLVLPMGFTDGGLPLSLQLGGRPFEEATLLGVGDAYQQVTGWHRQVPAMAAAAVAA